MWCVVCVLPWVSSHARPDTHNAQGLGKTVQAIAAILAIAADAAHPALVVVPTALLSNWAQELRRFAPSLHVSTYHGADRTLPVAASSSGASPKSRKRQRTSRCGSVVLTTYTVLRRDIATLRKVGKV